MTHTHDTDSAVPNAFAGGPLDLLGWRHVYSVKVRDQLRPEGSLEESSTRESEDRAERAQWYEEDDEEEGEEEDEDEDEDEDDEDDEDALDDNNGFLANRMPIGAPGGGGGPMGAWPLPAVRSASTQWLA